MSSNRPPQVPNNTRDPFTACMEIFDFVMELGRLETQGVDVSQYKNNVYLKLLAERLLGIKKIIGQQFINAVQNDINTNQNVRNNLLKLNLPFNANHFGTLLFLLKDYLRTTQAFINDIPQHLRHAHQEIIKTANYNETYQLARLHYLNSLQVKPLDDPIVDDTSSVAANIAAQLKTPDRSPVSTPVSTPLSSRSNSPVNSPASTLRDTDSNGDSDGQDSILSLEDVKQTPDGNDHLYSLTSSEPELPSKKDPLEESYESDSNVSDNIKTPEVKQQQDEENSNANITTKPKPAAATKRKKSRKSLLLLPKNKNETKATSEGIVATLTEILGDKAHIIHPNLNSVFNIFDEGAKGRQAAINFGENIDSIIQNNGGSLKLPIVAILNTAGAVAKNDKDYRAIGGHHWIAVVILPKYYRKSHANEEKVFVIDSMKTFNTLPIATLDVLVNGYREEFEAPTSGTDSTMLKRVRVVEPILPRARIISTMTLKKQQVGGTDCGWWAVDNALKILETGSLVNIIQPPEPTRAFELRTKYPKLGDRLDRASKKQKLVQTLFKPEDTAMKDDNAQPNSVTAFKLN